MKKPIVSVVMGSNSGWKVETNQAFTNKRMLWNKKAPLLCGVFFMLNSNLIPPKYYSLLML